MGSVAGKGSQQTARSYRRSRPRAMRMTWGERLRLFFGLLTTIILLCAIGAVGYIGYILQATQKSIASVNTLTEYRPGGVTQIFATDKDPKTGRELLLGQVYGKYKEFASIKEIPQ